ncbi:hypothetical protein C8D88_10438 [Lentzea atacamensis]|uniref:Secreted protein n=1 Tax=Lentzea atacamensis TaxID=531938 RepID=A0A316I3B1_9PSEU|nr:hypothetical protein [Lentzea atacamensis]PWK86877.1 hypothetical protein C8D88_10438 [Lentzea atacamensis]RAS67234.1 hypothetical protein C8D87_103573 [Lentzea atacamensis]
MKRTFAALAGLATTLGLLMVGGQASAAPAPQPRVEVSIQSQGIVYDLYDSAGNLLGTGTFKADPSGSIPGDSIQACDWYADGWGIETQLDINPGSNWDTDRSINTRGHSSPYCSGWDSGNIAENTPVAIRVCLVRSGSSPACSPGVKGSA